MWKQLTQVERPLSLAPSTQHLAFPSRAVVSVSAPLSKAGQME